MAEFLASLLDRAFKTTPVTLMRCPARRVGRPNPAQETHLPLRQRVSSGRRALHATRKHWQVALGSGSRTSLLTTSWGKARAAHLQSAPGSHRSGAGLAAAFVFGSPPGPCWGLKASTCVGLGHHRAPGPASPHRLAL